MLMYNSSLTQVIHDYKFSLMCIMLMPASPAGLAVRAASLAFPAPAAFPVPSALPFVALSTYPTLPALPVVSILAGFAICGFAADIHFLYIQ